MSKPLPWYKRDVDSWRGGTRGMSLELRGFYSECLDAMWDRQGPIEKDPTRLAILLCCNPRSVRKLLPQLLGLGKLIETPDGYYNRRMKREIEGKDSTPIGTEFRSNSDPIQREFGPKVAKNPMFSTRDLESEKETEKEKEKKEGQALSVARATLSGSEGKKVGSPRDGLTRALSQNANGRSEAQRSKRQGVAVNLGALLGGSSSFIDPALIAGAEGLGVDVDALRAVALRPGVENPSGYFQKLCKEDLRKRFPGISDNILGLALAGKEEARRDLFSLEYLRREGPQNAEKH